MAIRCRPFAALVWGCLLLGASGNLSAKTSCHVHPPADAKADAPSTPTTIGPYDTRDTCEQARRALFGQLGRCHCTAGFTPGWVGSESSGAPMPPGLPPGPAMMP